MKLRELAIFLSIILISFPCYPADLHSNDAPLTIRAEMKTTDFLQKLIYALAKSNHLNSNSMKISPPTIDLFAGDGRTLFHGEGIAATTSALNSLPKLSSSTPGTFSRDLMLNIVPTFQSRRAEILTHGGNILFATSTNDPSCSGCASLEKAVEALQRRKDMRGFVILFLKLTK